jgi:hypothetical protein
MKERLRRVETLGRNATLQPAKPARPSNVLENFALFGAKSFKNVRNRVILKKRFFLGGVSQNRPPPVFGGGNERTTKSKSQLLASR